MSNDNPFDGPLQPSRDVLLETQRFRVERATRTRPDGTVHSREIICHPGAVTIVPMVDEHHVCLIRNHRFAVAETLIELPAGTLEPAEEPALTAQRELAEETGYRAKEMRPLFQFYMSPGILDERMYLFLATDLTAGTPAREPCEQIENLVVPWTEAVDMVSSGQIHDAKTIVGLLFYDRLR